MLVTSGPSPKIDPYHACNTHYPGWEPCWLVGKRLSNFHLEIVWCPFTAPNYWPVPKFAEEKFLIAFLVQVLSLFPIFSDAGFSRPHRPTHTVPEAHTLSQKLVLRLVCAVSPP